MTEAIPEPTKEVEAYIAAQASETAEGLRRLRALIYEVASELPEIGRLAECLKWGQPAFTTPDTKSGASLRIGCPKGGGFALFTHCQTSIITNYATTFPGLDRIDGTRAVLFDHPDQIAPDRHGVLIASILRYHL